MIPRGIFPVLAHLSNTAQVLTMWHVTRTFFSCPTDIYISGGPWIFMMLLYADVYCQSNCLSVPGCQVLRGVIHNNNRAKAESGHWTGHLKKPVRDLGKFPTHHRSPAHPILSSALLQVAKSQITLRRTVYKQYSVVNLIFKRLSGFTGDTLWLPISVSAYNTIKFHHRSPSHPIKCAARLHSARLFTSSAVSSIWYCEAQGKGKSKGRFRKSLKGHL